MRPFTDNVRFELIAARVVEYADGGQGQANSGHIALIVVLQAAGRVIGIANTHLIWDPPGTASSGKAGLSTSAAVAERMPEPSAIPPRMAHLRRPQRNSRQ